MGLIRTRRRIYCIWISSLLIFCAALSAQAAEKDIGFCAAALSRALSSLKSTRFEKVAGISLVPEFKGEPEIYRRTFVDPAKTPLLQAKLKKLPPDEQAKAGFEAYLELRLMNYPKWVKKQISSVVKSAHIADGEILGRAPGAGHSGISLIVPNELRNSVSHYKLLAHETELAIQQAEVTMGLIKKSDPYLSEFGAMRAEWDFKRIFRSESLKQDIDRVKASRLPFEQKENEKRELSRTAETFEQFRSNRLASSDRETNGPTLEVPPAQPPISVSKTVKLAAGYSNRHSAAIDDLVVRRLLAKEDGDHILASGDPEKLWDVIASEKISDEEREKLYRLFVKVGDVKRPAPSAPQVIATAEKKEPIRKFVQGIEAAYGIEDLLDEPHLLRNGRLLKFSGHGSHRAQLRFENRALDELAKAERPIIQKFINARRIGMSSQTLDPTKIRILSGESTGSMGRLFEIPIIQRGHPRLFGCFKDGVFTIVTYDPQAPQTMAAFRLKYAGLCN